MDVPMKLVTILVFLVHSHSTFCSVVEAKRYDHTMVDPLTRRSPLDKNFMRFGRSSNTQDRVHEEAGETSPNSIDTQDDFLSDKDTFDRYARGKYDSFIRFGRDRGSQNFIRFGRSRNPQNFIRFGRGRNENFIRFGRDNQYTVPKDFQIDGNERSLDINTAEDKRKDNFLRFGRGRHENFIRFGRSLREDEQDNENNIDESNIPISMRAGGTRGNSNFLRFGRRQENFIRFGRGGQDRNFLRFGRASNRNFMRFGRAGNRNFMRFGRSDEPEDNKSFLFDESTPTFDQDDESFDRSIRDRELTRLGRQLPSERGDGFIRFGRNVEKESENNSSTGRDKRSIMDGNERAKRSILEDPSSGQVYTDMNTEDDEESTPEIFKLNSRSYFPVDIDDEYESGSIRRDFWNRKKRSLKDSVHTESPEILSATGNGVSRQIFDDQLQYDLPPLDYYPSPLSAGIPNFIVGPEFSLLPPLDVSTSKFKKGRPGDRNFIRLG